MNEATVVFTVNLHSSDARSSAYWEYRMHADEPPEHYCMQTAKNVLEQRCYQLQH
jgi:hypothetical protein